MSGNPSYKTNTPAFVPKKVTVFVGSILIQNLSCKLYTERLFEGKVT